MDISLLVFAVNSDKSQYNIGDIIDVSKRHFDGCSNDNLILVHIHGIPDTAPEEIQFKRLKEMFERQVTLEAFGEEVRRRAWRLAAEDTAQSVMDELISTRETVIDWQTAKSFLGKKVVSVLEDPTMDSMVFISDGDV